MPKGTRVDRMFQRLKQRGKSTASAARIAQSKTGQSLKTGKKTKKK